MIIVVDDRYLFVCGAKIHHNNKEHQHNRQSSVILVIQTLKSFVRWLPKGYHWLFHIAYVCQQEAL